MTEQKFQITVKDSVFQTKGAGLHMFLLFAVCSSLLYMSYWISWESSQVRGRI